MLTIPTIFDALGGPAPVSRMLGVKPSTASEMKRRQVIPVRLWPALVKLCEQRGVKGVTYDRLVELHTKKGKR